MVIGLNLESFLIILGQEPLSCGLTCNTGECSWIRCSLKDVMKLNHSLSVHTYEE